VGSRLREGVRRNNATFVMQSQLHRFRAAATGGQCSAICKPEKLFDHWSLHFPSLFELSECDLDLGLIKNGSYVKKGLLIICQQTCGVCWHGQRANIHWPPSADYFTVICTVLKIIGKKSERLLSVQRFVKLYVGDFWRESKTDRQSIWK